MNAEIITQCAWCGEVKVSGRYVTLGLGVLVHELDLPTTNGQTTHYVVSHGICGTCKVRMAGYSRAARLSAVSVPVASRPAASGRRPARGRVVSLDALMLRPVA
jgi:hypothetical protein